MALCSYGRVLFNGNSKHDLDVICYPHSTESYHLPSLYSGLKEAGLELWKTKDEMHLSWRQQRKSRDMKHVEIWMKGARRVDIIIWPPVNHI